MNFFFRKSMDHRSGLAYTTSRPNDNFAFSNRGRCQRLFCCTYHPDTIPPPCCPNSGIPRGWRHLVAMLTRVHQLRPGLIGILRALPGCVLEHQQRLQLPVLGPLHTDMHHMLEQFTFSGKNLSSFNLWNFKYYHMKVNEGYIKA